MILMTASGYTAVKAIGQRFVSSDGRHQYEQSSGWLLYKEGIGYIRQRFPTKSFAETISFENPEDLYGIMLRVKYSQALGAYDYDNPITEIE